jgi:hypothetical protein
MHCLYLLISFTHSPVKGNPLSRASFEAITRIMELVAERAGDITARVFERYFERSEASRALMDHMDEYMLGRMMAQVLLLLMDPDDEELAGYLEFETGTHVSYGVDAGMYRSLMAAVQDVIRESLGADFTADMQTALDARIEFLLDAINHAAAHHGDRQDVAAG